MRVILQGAEVPADGLEDFTVSKMIDYEDRVIRYEYPLDLTFVELGFKKLLDAREGGYCDLVDVEIQKQCGTGWETVIEGEIRLTNIEFNHKLGTARTKVKERDLLSRILNSWDKETSVTGGKDIYAADITTVTPQSTVFNHPFDDSPYSSVVKTWDFLQAVQYYVTYLTGSDLQVVSTWYSSLPSTQQIAITSGLNIRVPATSAAPVTSLEKIYKDMAAMFNLYMGIVYDGNTPQLRIEQESFWYSETVIANRNEVLEMKDRFDEDRLYSSVKIGSSTFIRGDGTQGKSFPDIPFFSFSNETFAITGSCNLDQSLDLSLDGIIDSNVIEDIIENATETYDDDVFYIQIDTDGGFSAYQPDDQFITGRSFFNPKFQKNEQILRYNFQGDVRREIDLGANTYKALYPTAPTLPISTGLSQLVFPVDSPPLGFDFNGNYNTSTSRFTAPNNDIYKFQLQYLYRILQINMTYQNHLGFLRGVVRRFDSLGNVKSEHLGTKIIYYIHGVNPFPSDVHFGKDYYDVFMEAGDYVEFYLLANVTNGVSIDDLILVSPGQRAGVTLMQYSECVQTMNAGGLIRQSDPSTYKVRNFEFEDQLSTEEMIDMIRHPEKGVGFAGLNVSRRTGWGQIDTTIKTGKTTFNLLCDTN